MFVPLPNLDDRRWSDLVDEGRALIPVYSPAWTDHNAHDPGITLMEMLAWIAETDIYRVDRIPDSHVRAFLSLVGIRVRPPSAARAVVAFTLKPGTTEAVPLPATTMLTTGAGATALKFGLRREISVQPAMLVAVQVESGGKFRDVTGDWQRGKPIALFGDNPQPGDSFYLGFDSGLESGASLSLYFELSGDKAGEAERQRILDEIAARRQSNCGRLDDCRQSPSATPPAPELPPHHSAVIVWEAQTAPGFWETIEATDDTRALTLSGSVVLPLSQTVAKARSGAVAKSLAYVRARFASGSSDTAPIAARVHANAVEVEQSAPVWEQWTVATEVVVVGTRPPPGGFAWLYVDFDASGQISGLEFAPEANDALYVRVLDYQPATNAQTGLLVVEAQRIGVGTGAPNQRYGLRVSQLSEPGCEVYTLELGCLRKWWQRESLLASGAADSDFVLEAGAAAVEFGDGQNGRVPPAGAVIIAVASETAGAGGNAAADTISALDLGLHNVALLHDPCQTMKQFERITNPSPAAGGADEETLAHAEGRAVQTLQKRSRAVTLDDCEALALETPGTGIARAAALANQHPGFQCYAAPGFITLVIVPHLPLGRPVPSAGLLAAVSAYLNRRHVIGTRIEVTAPEYLEVGVNAGVRAFPGQNKTVVRDAVVAALQKFLDPLQGGADGAGWPLGRDVYISEVVEVIAAVPGVDHVVSIELEVPGCGAQCGNVCLRPLALTVSGTHQIKVS
jgi:predicted phage baseplate assembly protein